MCAAVRCGAAGQAGQTARTWQTGQAVAEGLVVLTGLALAVLAIVHTGRWHGAALHTGLAARQSAFAWTRGEPGIGALVSSAHAANPLVDTANPVADAASRSSGAASVMAGKAGSMAGAALQLQAVSPIADGSQPGGGHAQAGALRRQWGMHDTDIHAAHAVMSGLRLPFGVQRLSLRRHTAILAGAGHARDDADVQRRMAQSVLAWGDAAGASQQAGGRVAERMAPVDRAWGRPQVDFDWLQPWAGALPPEHTQAGSRAGRGQ